MIWWWYAGKLSAPTATAAVVETPQVGDQPTLGSDYQQRLDLYYQRRAESETCVRGVSVAQQYVGSWLSRRAAIARTPWPPAWREDYG